ncbi:MAG: exodeoxyribonuclease III [Deltaproteobacteria bacterium]|nr:exodeoxyribonuclease III [Deltaproteobacteria bacterium]
MKLATFNANSIRARLEIITDWLQKEQPDVLCIQETKVQDKDFPIKPFTDMGYQPVIKGQKSYNGVATVSKHPLEEIRLNLYEGEEEEARFISAVISGIPVINVYVPQGLAPKTEKFDYKLRFLKDLLSHVKRNYDAGQPLLLAGDLNVALEDIDVHDPEGLRGEVGFHPEEQEILREYLAWGFVDVFRKHESGGGLYTFWDYRVPNGFKRNIGWRIDYVLATPSLAETSRRVWIDTEPRTRQKASDHTFLVAEFQSPSW